MATRIVKGKYLTIYGTPCAGVIEFTPSSNTIRRGTAVYMATTLKVPLSSDGSFTTQLMVTDDPTLEPVWKWIVEEKIEGGKIWYLEVPTGDGSPIDISDVVPSSALLISQPFEVGLEELRHREQAWESE